MTNDSNLSLDWVQYRQGQTIGTLGSEHGFIIRDEELSIKARITMEHGGRSSLYSITCGVYGWLVHTVFFSSEEEAQAIFINVKHDLEEIIAAISAEREASEIHGIIRGFVQHYS